MPSRVAQRLLLVHFLFVHCSCFTHYMLKFLWKTCFSSTCVDRHWNDSKKLVSLRGNKVNYRCLMQFQIYAKHLSNFCLVERKLHCHDKCWILVNQPVRCLSTYFYIFRQSHCCQKDSEYLQLCFLLSESAYWFKKDEMPTIDWSVQLCFIFHLLFLSKYFLNYILLLAHQVRQFMDICDVHKQTL